MLWPGSGRLGNWGVWEETGGASSRAVLASSAGVELTLTAPDRFLNIFPGSQFASKKFILQGVFPSAKRKHVIYKKPPENLTLTDRSPSLSHSPLLLPEPSAGTEWGDSPVTHLLY